MTKRMGTSLHLLMSVQLGKRQEKEEKRKVIEEEDSDDEMRTLMQGI